MLETIRTDLGVLGRMLRPSLLLALPLLGSCATGGGNPFVETSNRDGYLLRVESRHSYDVEVYINPSGRRQLLGTVRGNGLEFFEFAYPTGRPLVVELESRLGELYRLPATPFPGGGRVDLMILSDLRRSGYIRRAP